MVLKNLKKHLYIFILFGCLCCWGQNMPPQLTAIGDQSYCPTTQINIATSFNITDPDDTQIDAFFIQISTGYTSGEDELILTGTHPNIVAAWDVAQGKLSLAGVGGIPMDYTDLIAAVNDVVFQATLDTDPGDKLFSFTIGDANFLPSTGHYYEYVPDLGITWTAARAAADARTYFGLKGYLATITSDDEAQLSGEQSAGAGWIGGSDAETEGVWKWVTGPEAGTIFWNGGINGTTPNYANWNTNEPNQSGDEDYAHVTAPGIGIDGSWNDLSNTGNPSGPYQPKGYIVEYGGTPGDPVVDISASTKINIPSIKSTVVPSASCGPSDFTLEAVASSGDAVWFENATDTTPIFTGAIYNTPTVNGSRSYFVMASVNGCLQGERTEVAVTVNPIPTIDDTTTSTICESGSITVSAMASAGTINWYTTAVGGTAFTTGDSYTTPVLTDTAIYYVDATQNGCTTTTRTPIVVTVEKIDAPTGPGIQEFCDVENATLSDIVVTGTGINWYSSDTGGTPLDTSTSLQNNTAYYASQTVGTCEGSARLQVDVLVYETVVPLANEIDPIEACDSMVDGDETDGLSLFDLTEAENELLNGSNAADFNFLYFTDAARNNPIAAPEAFQSTAFNTQAIYVRIENNLNTGCFTDASFNIQVNPIPVIQTAVVFKNCDDDGMSDGFTDFNLNELDEIITNGANTDLNVLYYTAIADAEAGAANSLTPVPYNNQTASTIYARVENIITGCYDISTVTLEVSATQLDPSFIVEFSNCDADAEADGFYEFDLTTQSNDFISQFPGGQNLSVRYFRTLADAQLEENEILTPQNYTNETPFNQTIYVRVESEDNGECFGIGPNLVLIVHPRPTFEVDQSEPFCLNGGSVRLETFNPGGTYIYEWRDSNNNLISNADFAEVVAQDIYTVTATSDQSCVSFPVQFEVKASGIADIDVQRDITINDLSDNNTITIDTSDIGIGDYEFALDNEFGPFQDSPMFTNVGAGEHVLYTRDKNGCGTVATTVFVMGFPKFFTPNNDTHNDTWDIRGLSSEYTSNTTVFIYDRYGKLIKQLIPGTGGWDGTFNGQALGTNDYWYVVNLIDGTGNLQVFTGHFSLIR